MPEEREWMDKFFENGWRITFREFNRSHIDIAGGASDFLRVRVQNKGWRIDYIDVTDPLKKNVKDAEIYPDVMHSDHCPVYIDIKRGQRRRKGTFKIPKNLNME